MATATTGSVSTQPVGESRFVIRNVGWSGYLALLGIVGEGSIRLIYAWGDVELMSPHLPHESFRWRLGFMVGPICEELEIPFRPAGALTLKREELDRGLEADESYYLASLRRVADREEIDLAIDLAIDPPPDLAIEIEITSGILRKIEIYARLGVPEVWRFDGEVLTALLLQPDGTYAISDTSRSFPLLVMDELSRFLLDPDMSNETRWAKAFRLWVREALLPPRRNPAGPD